jgi:hypothetical protein
VKRASKETLAGRRYLDLQREAKRTGRPTDELIQLYALECFLDRLVHSEFADTFILKGPIFEQSQLNQLCSSALITSVAALHEMPPLYGGIS